MLCCQREDFRPSDYLTPLPTCGLVDQLRHAAEDAVDDREQGIVDRDSS